MKNTLFRDLEKEELYKDRDQKCHQSKFKSQNKSYLKVYFQGLLTSNISLSKCYLIPRFSVKRKWLRASTKEIRTQFKTFSKMFSHLQIKGILNLKERDAASLLSQKCSSLSI